MPRMAATADAADAVIVRLVAPFTGKNCPTPHRNNRWWIKTAGLGTGAVAVQVATATESGGTAGVLAGEVIVQCAVIGAAAVIGCRCKADIQVAVTSTGGVLEGCVVGMAFLAVAGAGVITVMFGVTAGCATGAAVGWCAVALVTVI